MTIEMALKLKERLEQNMGDFMASLSDYTKETIIGMAHTIAAMDTAYRLLATADLEDDNAAYLLQFQNPVEIVAEEFVSVYKDADEYDFMDFIYDFVEDENEDNMDIYPLMPNFDEDGIDPALCEACNGCGIDEEMFERMMSAFADIIELILACAGLRSKE